MSDTLNIANSIWPNGMKVDSDGHAVYYPLGTKKVKVPTSSSEWPKGDKLVSPFVYDKDDKLVGFIDTKALTVSKNTAIYLPYEHIDAEFSAINKGRLQIHAPNATTKKASWKNSGIEDISEAQYKYKGCKTVDDVKNVQYDYLADIANGTWSEPLWDLERGTDGIWNSGMFYGCSQLTTFNSDLLSLTDGDSMFYSCTNLTSFSSDLSSMTSGSNMFYGCSQLTTFTSDLPSLTYGVYMFSSCSALTSFNTDLSSMTAGQGMFHDCTNLTSFNSNLSTMTNGIGMFHDCTNLTSFSSDLSSLTEGINMFLKCKLDAPSVKNIIDTINTCSATLYIGMGCDNTTEDKDLFAQEVGYTDMTSLLAALKAKKWTVTAQYTGRPTTTYGLRRPFEDTLPVFVKLEESEDYADYTSLDDSKKFRLTWFHETTGSTEGYTQFNSLEEAVETLNIKPIEN